MRAKNKLALRVLSTAAVMTMVTSIAAPAFADAYGIDVYGIYNIGNGSVTVVGNKVTYTDDKGKLHKDEEDTDEEGIIITGKSDKNNVTLNGASVTIKDLDIDASETGKAAISTSGKTTIELDGNNKLTGGKDHAGLEKWSTANNNVPDPNHTLTITDKDNDGSLTATGGAGGAGIGSAISSNCGYTNNITITGGTITAIGGKGAAGIGGGKGDSSKATNKSGGGNASNITITGENTKVTATGNGGGSGIGGGQGDGGDRSGQGLDITIKGGAHVEATGSDGGAGIGGGDGSEGGEWAGLGSDITITGKGTTVIANGGNKDGDTGSGIGGGQNGQGYRISITGGADVTATGGKDGGAGIGGGKKTGIDEGSGSGNTITIGDSTVTATGNGGGAGIGGGNGGNDSRITIDGGNVTANGSAGGAGIGTGDATGVDTLPRAATIKINGGNVTATGGSDGGAGIGGGKGTAASTRNGGRGVTISGGNVTAVGGNGAAGIGSGKGSTWALGSFVDITGGIIKATGGKGNAAGIGNGENDAHDATVNISATTADLDVTAITRGSVSAITGENGLTMADLTNDFSGVVRSMRKGWLFTYLYNTVHNGKYVGMANNNADDHLKTDAHIWGSTEIIKQATPTEKGILRHHCAVEGCKGYYDEEFDYVEPDDPTPVTPVKPDPKPGETPETPETPAAPAPGGTTDVVETPAAGGSTEVTPAGAVTDTGKAETVAAAPAQSTKAPAQNAAALPQTGANWLAVLGSALSGFALMAVGFFLNRKRGSEQH